MMTLIAVNEHCKYDSIDDTSLYVDKETEIQTHSAMHRWDTINGLAKTSAKAFPMPTWPNEAKVTTKIPRTRKT